MKSDIFEDASRRDNLHFSILATIAFCIIIISDKYLHWHSIYVYINFGVTRYLGCLKGDARSMCGAVVAYIIDPTIPTVFLLVTFFLNLVFRSFCETC